MNNGKHPPISVHQTLSGQLEVDWRLKYHQEYNCPICNKGSLTIEVSH